MSMSTHQPDGLEGAFAKAESDVEIALKAATNVLSALRRFRGAARQGKVRELRAAGEAAKRSIQVLDQEIANVAESWEFDEEGFLQSGGFVDELIARADRDGVRISQQDNRLYCYPVLLRVLPAERAVLIDKARERRLRPSVLVRLLRDLQKRPARFKPLDFLHSLHAAYRVAVQQQPGRLVGTSVIPLLDIYELLTMLPGQAREYSRQEFARDLYLLDQSGETRTKTGDRLEFHASTGTRLRRGTLSVVTQTGQEKKYYGISFTRAAEG
jgi:hypothetical protein